MQQIHVADVGDGLCLSFRSFLGNLTQVDCGTMKEGEAAKALSGLYRTCFPFPIQNFILSHYHSDHYNGLVFASRSYARLPKEVRPFQIERVYFPRMPKFPEQKEFLKAIFAMNEFILGSETGLMEYDFVRVADRVSSVRVMAKGLTQGDAINAGGSFLRVVWPPPILDDTSTRKKVKDALKDFGEALTQSERLKSLHEAIEEGAIDGYFSNNVIEGPAESVPEQLPKWKERNVEIPEAVNRANKALRNVANHLSLAFYVDDRLLFMGDATNFEIQRIVSYLRSEGRAAFLVFITPHHGTHWHDDLQEIRWVYGISSNGPQLCRHLKHGFKENSKNSFTTHANGDVALSLEPVFPDPKRLMWYRGLY